MGLNIKIGFQVDDKQIVNSLTGIKNDIQNAFNTNLRMSDQISQAVVEAKALERAMKRATTDKGISYYSLQAELRKCGTSAAQLTANLAAGGEQFRASLNAANVALATSNRTVISLNSQIKEMARVMLQSFKFTAAQTVIRNITKMCQQAVGWVKELNSAVNAIGVVTGKSEAQLAKVTEDAIQGAKNLRIAADEYAKAALIFYQQGLGDEEVALRTEITIKAAKAAGVAVDEMSQQLTAIWNTYGMIGDEQARAASVGAKLAANTAADFADIAEAMQTSASAASQMGVAYDSLAAIIATVKDTTQQSASTIGNAYKTIFSRFEQLKSAGTDGEVTLNRVSKQLDEMGIHVLDSSGELRLLDDVIMETGEAWDTYTQKQKLAIAETVGGTRQYGQFLALMQNFDKYKENLQLARDETGADTLEQQYTQAMESVEEKAARTAESWKRAFGEIINERQLKAVYDTTNKMANTVETIFKGVNGLPGILAIVASMLSSKIGPQAANIASNLGVGFTSVFSTQKGRDKRIDKDYNAQSSAVQAKQAATTNAIERENLNIQKQKLEVSRETAHTMNQIDTLEKSATGNYKIKLESLREGTQKALESYQANLDELNAMKQITAENERLLTQEEARLQDERTILLLRVQEAELISDTANTIAQDAETAYNTAKTKNDAKPTKAGTAKVERLKAAWDEAKIKAQEASAAFKEAEQVLAVFDKGIQINRVSNNFTSLIEQVRQFSATGEGSFDILKTKIDEFAIRVSNGGINLKDIDSELQKMEGLDLSNPQAYMEAYLQAVTNALNKLNLLDEKTVQVAQTVVDKTQDVRSSRTTINKNKDEATKPPTPAEGGKPAKIDVSGAIGGLTQLTTAAITSTMAITNLYKVMSKPSAEFGEKMSALGSSLLMLIPSCKSVASGIKMIATAMKASVPEVIVLAVAIAAVTAALIYFAEEAHNASAAGKLEQMQRASEALKANAQATAEAAENLRNSFSKYEEVKKKLDECKRGTEEWKTVLGEVNTVVQEIVKNLPKNISTDELNNLFTNEGGVQVVNEEAYKEQQEKLDAAELKASFAAALGEMEVSKGQIGVLTEGIAAQNTDKWWEHGLDKAVQKGAEMAIAGGVMGSALTPVGTVVGAGIGLGVGTIGGFIEGIFDNSAEDANIGKIIQDNLEALLDESDGVDFATKLKELAPAIEMDSDALKELEQQLKKYSGTMNDANTKLEKIARSTIDAELGDKYSTEEKALTAKNTVKLANQKSKEIYGTLTGLGRNTGNNNATVQKLYQRYVDAGGTKQLASNAIRGSSKNRTIHFQGDDEGMTAQEFADFVAASEAMKELAGSAQKARTMLDGLSGSAQKGANAFLANNNLDSLNKKELTEMQGVSKEDFDANETLTMIYGTYDAYTEAIQKSLDGISDAAHTTTESVRSTYTQLSPEIGGITANTASTLVNALNDGFIEGGKEGLAAVKDVISKIGPEAFEEIYNDMNWKNPSLDKLKKKLIDLELNSSDASDAAEKLISSLKKQTEATLESAQTTYAAVHKISDSLDDYEVISPDDLQTLANAGVAVGAYFETMADGTSMLIADASEFKRELEQISLKGFYDTIEIDKSRMEALNPYQGRSSENNNELDYNSIGTGTKIQLMEAIGNIDTETQALIQEYRSTNDAHYASKINAAFKEAGINQELIDNYYKEAEEELEKAKAAINEANFQNDVKAFGLDLAETTEYASRLSTELGLTEKQAKDLAIANQRLDRGLSDLNDNLDDYKKSLKNTDKLSAEYSKTITKLKGNLADMFNIGDEDMLSDTFAEDTLNSEDLTKALDGDVEALERLRNAAAIDIGDHTIAAKLGKQLEEAQAAAADTGWTDNLREVAEKAQEGLASWETLKTAINGGIGNMPIDEFETAMNGMISAAGMTYEQVTSMLGAMGVSATVKTDYQEQDVTVPTQYEYSQVESDPAGSHEVSYETEGGTVSYTVPGWRRHTWTVDGPPYTGKGFVPVYSVEVESGDTSSGGTLDSVGAYQKPTVSNNSTTSGKKSSGGGGGGSKPKKFSKGKYHERYKDTKHQLDSVGKAMERFNKAADDSVGAAKLNNIKKASALLAKQGQLYSHLYKEALAYATADKVDLTKALATDNIKVKFDTDGTIANMEEIQHAWDDMLNAVDANANGLLDENEQELYEKTKEHIEEQQELLEKYTSAVDEMNEALEAAVQNIRDYMSKQAEAINVKLEFNLDPLERDIKALELTTDLLGKLGVTTGKTIKLIGEQVDKTFSSYKEYSTGAASTMAEIDNIQKSLTDPKVMSDYIDKFGPGAWDKYLKENGGVPAELLDQLKEYTDSIGDQISDLNGELDDLYSTYAEMFEDFLSRFDEINARIELNAEKLELYEKIYEASGDKSTDRKAAEADIASAKRNNKEAAYQTAQNKRDTLKEQLARDEKALADFQKQYGTDTSKYDEASAAWYNRLKEMVDNTKEGLQDAESEVISTLGDVLDAAVEEAEKKTELARAKFVESITNGMFNDIEMMSTYYDDLEQKRKFYVDDYDKDYYLDKFDYQIDDYLKDANIVDPSRMAEWEEFQQRINDLRAEGVELTQAQIDKLQAEFELQKLYDQYEEAQNAKTTMRLTRDASGNYNYVYSSDSTAEDAADIAQKIKDKEKEIRDMGKSIIEEMSNTYLETSKELEAYLAENGGVADEHAMMLKERLDMMAAQIKQQCNETGIKFSETSLGIISDTEYMDECHQKFTESFITLETAEKEANTEKAKVISDNCDDIGIDYQDLSSDIGQSVQAIIADDNAAAIAAKNLKTETSKAMTEAATSVATNAQKICSSLRTMIQEYRNLIDEIKKYNDLAGQEVTTYDENTDYSAYLYNKWKSYDGSWEEFQEEYRSEINQRMAAGAAREVDAGQNFTDAVNKLAKAFEDFEKKGITSFENWNHGDGTSNKTASGGLIKTPQVRSLAEEGPELVLNATDTQNILDAVKEVRSTVISRQIALKGAPVPEAPKTEVNETTPVLQDVKIDATFPNVSVASEVEDALTDLINKTAQYAKGK